MSTDYRMVAVFGVKVRKRELYTDNMVANCEHTHDRKFCPECGKPAGSHPEITKIPGMEGEGRDLSYKGLRVVSDLHPRELDGDNEVVVGIVVGRSLNHHDMHGRVVECDQITNEKVREVDRTLETSPFSNKKRALYMVLEASY